MDLSTVGGGGGGPDELADADTGALGELIKESNECGVRRADVVGATVDGADGDEDGGGGLPLAKKWAGVSKAG